MVPDESTEEATFVNRGGELVPASTYSFPNSSPPDSLLPAWPCAEIELGLALCLGSAIAAPCCRTSNQDLSKPAPSDQPSLAAPGSSSQFQVLSHS